MAQTFSILRPCFGDGAVGCILVVEFARDLHRSCSCPVRNQERHFSKVHLCCFALPSSDARSKHEAGQAARCLSSPLSSAVVVVVEVEVQQ